jgi:ABC-type sugar transport system ATPase subunit
MARLLLENLTKTFSGARGEPVGALQNLNLAVEDGELLALVGPSGCGKTTTLRLIAGLEQPDAGAILLDGLSLSGVAPKDRDVGDGFPEPRPLSTPDRP